MKKLLLALALALLLVPGFVMAQAPPGCSWEGDACFRLGWGAAEGWSTGGSPCKGIDYYDLYPGQELYTYLYIRNVPNTYTSNCSYLGDSFCFEIEDKAGWDIVSDPAAGTQIILPAPNASTYQDVYITAPCDAAPCDYDTIIAHVYYTNVLGVCDPTCLDCTDPNVYGGTVEYYSTDTLIIHVIEAPPALGVFQDTLTLVDQGATQAHVPFTICNQDLCAPVVTYSYNIKSLGVVGPALNVTGTVNVGGGGCKDVYGIIDAGDAEVCDWDTLTIIVWTPEPVVYDTCVQVIHVIEPISVPLFTVPVVTILVLALILAAAVFMRRRAVSRA